MNDNHDIVRALEGIKSELHKPFDDMNQDRRHRDILEFQSKNHKEFLASQNEFNKNMLNEQRDLAKWTKVLAIATIMLAIATILLVFISK